MATVFTHPCIAIGVSPWFRNLRYSKKIIVTGMAFTALPDIDVIGLRLGIPYEHLFGHRGITHSIFFAFLLSLAAAWILSPHSEAKFTVIWSYLFVCLGSHGILDAFTNGGHGIAFFAPFSNERFFFPVRPLEVSPLSIRYFFQGRGLRVLESEMIWVVIPSVLVFMAGYYRDKKMMRTHTNRAMPE